MRRTLLLLLVIAACRQSPSTTKVDTPPTPTPAAEATAFVDATVIAMDRDGALPHQTVIVTGDRITAVGPVASTPVPAGARTIDARGTWLIPGLADMHVHTYDPDQLALFVTRGVTTIRIMWGDAGTVGRHGKSDARLAPTIYSTGEIVDGDPPIWPGSIGVHTAAEATAAVERQHRVGYDYVKVYARLTPDEYGAIVATAAKYGMPVIGHVPTQVGLGAVLAAKQRSVEHLDGMMRFAERDDSPLKDVKEFSKRAGAYQYADDAKLADAIKRTVAAGTWNCPTLVVLDRISHLDHPDTARPELAYVPASMIAAWDPAKDFRFQSATADDFATMRGAFAWDQAVVKRLFDAGAPILAGTDVGNPWLVPGYALHDELGLLVGAGLTPFQALQTATVNPADFLAARAEQGTIAAGRRADLVLLDADPLADIANTRAIAGVMLRGRWLPAAELTAERDRIAATYAGERSRFAGVAAAAPAPAFSAVYRASSQFASGEERVTATATTLIAETRMDGEPTGRWELELGAGGLGTRLHVVQDGLDVTVVRDGDHAKVTGTVGGDHVAFDEPVADDELLAGVPLGIDVAWHRKIAAIPTVGGQLTIKGAVLQLRPTVHLEHLMISATREADSTRAIGGAEVLVHVFALDLAGELVLDTDGYAVQTVSHTRE